MPVVVQPQGCHLVGSVPLQDAETVFRTCLATAAGRLKRITDGETGNRLLFTTFQADVFNAYPAMKNEFIHNAPINNRTFTPEEIDDGIKAISQTELQTGYDKAAIASYAVFQRLRAEGVIPPGVRFQVCIPSSANVIIPFIQREFLPRVEPVYEAALFRAIRNIQDAIPHEDLAIQLDLAVDTAFWEATNPETVKENSGLEWFKPWWEGDVKEYCTKCIVRLIEKIDPDVEVGLHNCYGDMQHRHWHEPSSLAVVVERQKRVTEASPRKINWSHMPVPKSAVERPEVGLEKFLSPLKDLLPIVEKYGTEIYLGVVHEYKPDLTKQMIEAVHRVVPELKFGVATECGGGRMDWAAFEDTLKIAAEVSDAVV